MATRVNPSTGQLEYVPDTLLGLGATGTGAEGSQSLVGLAGLGGNATIGDFAGTGNVIGNVANNTGAAIPDGLASDGGGALSGLTDYLGGQSLGDIAGLAGLGLNAYSSLFGTGNDIAQERLGLLRQQRSSNQEALDNRRKFNENFANASNSLAGSRS